MIDTKNKKLTIAIVGAGMAGLVMAHALSQRNFNVKLFEKTSELTNIGGGFFIYPHGIRILKLLGFEDLINELFVNVSHLDIYNRNGRLLLHENLTTFYEKASAPLIPMSRTSLQQRLAKSLPEGTLLLNHQCINIEQQDNHVHVDFLDQPSIEADILIGADGIQSITRTSVTDAITKEYTGMCFWGGILNQENNVNITPETLVNILGIEKAAWIAPMANQQQMWYITHKMPINKLDKGQDKLTQIRSLCQNWSPWVDEILAYPQNQHTFAQPIHQLSSSNNWVNKRVALIGDAAHAFGPVAGQGYSLAMVDAFILAECLQHGSQTPDEALRSYKHIRGDIVKQHHHIEEQLQLIQVTDDETTISNREKFYTNPPSSGVLKPILDLITQEAFEKQLALAKKS